MNVEFISSIKTIRYKKDDFYILTVLKPHNLKKNRELYTKYNNHLIVIKGKSLIPLNIGDSVYIEGKIEISNYNNEPVIEANKIEKQYVVSKEGFINFLTSFKGIGKKKAEEIVKLYSENIETAKERFISDILSDNENLNLIKILNTSIYENVKKVLESNEFSKLSSSEEDFIKEFNIPKGVVKKIKKAKKDIIKIFTTNPYIIALEVKGIGFKTADKIAYQIKSKLNIPDDIFYKSRFIAGLYYSLIKGEENGHTFLREMGIKHYLKDIIHDFDKYDSYFDEAVKYLKDNEKIYIDNDKYYLYQTYLLEKDTAKKICSLLRKKKVSNKADILYEDFTPSEEQKEAIEKAFKENILIITGGPGTGKTTVSKYIYKNFIKQNKKVKLLAPTGTAAKRIGNVIGTEAFTVHRALKIGHNSDTPVIIKDDIVIIDESSMLDLFLTNKIVSSVSDKTKVIFIGDKDQLPSIGIGNCLDDMEKAGVPTVRLNRIYRQDNDNPVVDFAYDVNNGNINYYQYMSKNINFSKKLNIIIKKSYLKNVNEDYMLNIEQDCIEAFLEVYKETNDLYNIQILSQTRKRKGGTERINKIIQEYINNNDFIDGTNFKIGDKVIQKRNNYKKDIFNGSIGIIKDVNGEQVIIEFLDGTHTTFVEYSLNNKDENENINKNIELAYAMTIHKSQGNEWKDVFIIFNDFVNINRKLIFTAVTRTRDRAFIFTNHSILQNGIKTEYGIEKINNRLVKIKRNSSLDEKIMKECKKHQTI